MAAFVRASISAAFEPHGAGPLHGRHQPVEYLLDGEDLLLGDAEQVVVVGAALDDAAGGAVEVGRFIDDDGRIARPGDDRPLRLLHGRPGHARPAGDADQVDVGMLEQGVGRFERRLGDDAHQVVDAQVAVDRLVVAADALGRHAPAARMRIEHHRVARGDHADRVAGDAWAASGSRA